MKYTEFIKGTYCKAMNCLNYEYRKTGDNKACRTICGAFKFHEWLDKNGYKIIKKVDNEK